jgi:long-chain acyl-CoA synthetase
MRSIVAQIFSYAGQMPDKTALLDGKREVSYKGLCQGICYAQSVLRDKYALQQGDTIILAANKQISFVFAYFAAHLLGVMVVPIDPETNTNRYQYIYEKVQPKLVVGFTHTDYAVEFAEFDGQLEIPTEQVYPEADCIADIIFTTGTTGEPKGVTLTQANIAAAAKNINSFIGNTEQDVELLALPISHSFGLGRLRCVLSKGATILLLGSFANMKRFFRFMDEYPVSGLAMVPSSWAYVKKMSGERLFDFADKLKYIEIGSAAMPMEEKQLLLNRLPDTRICMHYGLTEASRSAFIEFHQQKEYLHTVGKATPGMQIVIKDEQGNNCPLGMEGEICVKGDAVTKGYYKSDAINAQSYWGDYFRTGDWGTMDAEGYITLKSRKKELINVGGKKVSPIEVEDALRTIPAIQDCACVGIPDKNHVMGEVVKAFIVTSQSDLDYTQMSQLLGKQLEAYKVPVEYEVIASIPRTSSGKIQRLLLK